MSTNNPKESMLQPGISVAKAIIIYIGVVFILAAGTASSQSISQIQTAILTKYNGMDYFAMLTALATMGMVIMMPVSGKFSDMFGRKIMLWVGTALFSIGSVVTSLAPSLGLFLVARAIIPFGQACTMVVAYSVLAGVFQGKGRNIFYGLLSGILALGMFLGGYISGWLADIDKIWIAIFYPGILLFIGAVLVSTQIKNVRREGKIYVDYPGIICLAITVVGMIYTTTFGSKAGWTSPLIIGSIVMFVGGLILLVVVEKKSPNPIIAIEMFKNPIVVGILLITVFTVVYQRPMQVYIPMFLQQIIGVSAATSSTVLLARTVTCVLLPTFIAGWVGKSIGTRLWKVLFLCGLSIAVAFVIILGASASTSLVVFFLSYALMGVAEACKGAVITPFLQSAVDKKDVGAATSLNSFFGTAGSSIAACFIGLYYNAAVPNPEDLVQLQKGLNGMFVVSIITGVIVVALAVFFVRSNQIKQQKANESAK